MTDRSLSAYVNPKSLAFRCGAALVALGMFTGAHDVVGLGVAGDLVRAFVGDIGPATLIAQGLGLIGIRRALPQ